MKGYKAFDKNLKCMDMQYEIGKEYIYSGEITICEKGFHFCKTIKDCYIYYPLTSDTRICRIEAIGDIITNDKIKYCTNRIKIISEVKNPIKKTNIGNFNTGYFNTGYFNSGNCNTGNYNTGYFNSGNYNTGDFNSGNYNTGDCNSGHSNTGNYNTGDCNSGDCNTGDFNIGDFNTGDFNAGNYNTGFFNTKNSKIKIFDNETDITFIDWCRSDTYLILCKFASANTNELRQELWDNLSNNEKQKIYNIPFFDAEKFKICTGIDVNKKKGE